MFFRFRHLSNSNQTLFLRVYVRTGRSKGVYIFMKITVCIGSSCHVKGSRQVVKELQRLIAEHNADDKVELSGTFCMSQCQLGVCVTLDDAFHSVTPETVVEFFNTNVLPKL